MALFEQARQHLAQQKPFVIYSKAAQQSIVGLFQNDADLHLLEDYTAGGFVCAPFAAEKPVFIPYDSSTSLVEAWQPEAVSAREVPLNYAEQDKADFEALVRKGVEAIEAGAFDKVVFSRKETLNRDAGDVLELYKRLKSTYPTAFCYLFFHPQVGMWMGATPEQLIRVSDDQLYTMALAGTQVNRQQQTVVWGEKEQQEQRFVTDFIVDSLRPYLSDLSTTKPFTAYAGNVMHIRTDIQGTLSDRGDLKNILDQLHPTPAVCGMPKGDSRDFIQREEGYDRKYYSGYLGELNGAIAEHLPGQSDLFVNLRCMEIEKNQIHLYIGCGITKDSIPSDEFMETAYKSQTMKKIIEA
ncbi:chorismate-binding protein [Flavobacterium sp. JP2137]|uniref:chorismate-binding protein n=1 Tax=Flavobacterium sp. JP2137 TaxID=3414510 RepID=UPI003D2FF145